LEAFMAKDPAPESIPLPPEWPTFVKSSLLHVISLAYLSIIYARGWAANSCNMRVRLQGQLDESRNEIEKLKEELRIKDTRMASLDPHRRPYYKPIERMAILQLRAAQGWSTAQTAKRFLVQPATIASWMKRIDEGGEGALLQTREPVNKFPEFVRYIVQLLRLLCPTMGKKRIAQSLARAGLHLGVTTVGRMLKEKGRPPRAAESAVAAAVVQGRALRPVVSKYPNHVWLVDLTVVPTTAGFWAPWIPWALPQVWPLCWWIGVVLDHYSRRVMGFVLFREEPNSEQVRGFLGRTISRVKAKPKYIISDKGGQFWCPGFKAWCKGKGIDPRYCSTGQTAATSVLERFFRSLKEEWLRRISIPLRREAMRKKVALYVGWYGEHRAHQGLYGRTPNEVYDDRCPANEKPRFEPRPRWPRDSLCAFPQAKLRRSAAAKLRLVVTYHGGQKQLPIFELKRAA
jgi:putative transposase